MSAAVTLSWAQVALCVAFVLFLISLVSYVIIVFLTNDPTDDGKCPERCPSCYPTGIHGGRWKS